MKKTNLLLLLTFLLVGNANLRADTTDPFPEVNPRLYADNMSITAKVQLNGVELGEGTVVAVYHNDEIRGKATPISQDPYTNIFYIDVWGDTSVPLVFKVFTNGQTYTVDLGVVFTVNAQVGSLLDLLYIKASSAVGDITCNGLTNTEDVNALAEIVLGKDKTAPYSYNHQTADVNGDGKISMADLSELVQTLLQ